MNKRALLIGMSQYIPSRSVAVEELTATKNDVRNLSKKLNQLKFSTTEHMDLQRLDMIDIIQDFANNAPCDSINIIYFSGHGGHSLGENYLYPVDFGCNLDKGLSMENSAINLKSIPPRFSRKVKLVVIIDACRTNFTRVYNRRFKIRKSDCFRC